MNQLWRMASALYNRQVIATKTFPSCSQRTKALKISRIEKAPKPLKARLVAPAQEP